MNNYRSLNHTKWECQYHVVFIPKYRRKTLYGGLRHYLGDVLRRLAEHSGRVGWRKGICWRITSHMLRVDSAEILGCAGDRVYQGEECDPHRSGVCGRGPGTSWGSTSGHGATTSRRSGRMNGVACGNTSSSRNAKTGGWSNLRLEE